MEDDLRLVDVGPYPEIHADDIGDVHFLRHKVRIFMFEWFKIDGLYRRGITGTVVRLKSSFTAEQLAWLATYQRATTKQREECEALIH